MRNMERIPRLAAVGDNCMDVYDQTGEAFPGGNPVNVAVYTLRLAPGKASTSPTCAPSQGRRQSPMWSWWTATGFLATMMKASWNTSA